MKKTMAWAVMLKGHELPYMVYLDEAQADRMAGVVGAGAYVVGLFV